MALEMGRWRKQLRCPTCGHFFTPRGSNANTPGAPDLLISHVAWPAPLWLGVELKTGPDAEVQPEQRALCEAGRTLIAWTWEQVWAAIQAAEAVMQAGRE